MPGENDHIVAETAARIFADLANPQTINRMENGAWKEPLWQTLGDAGLPLAWVPEKLGGSGASLAEGFAILVWPGALLSRCRLPKPWPPVGCWRALGSRRRQRRYLAPARPNERITIGAGGTLSGRASGVSFAQDCAHIALLADDGKRQLIALVDVKDCRLAESRNLAGDGSNTVTLDRVKPKRIAPVPDGFDATSLLLMGSAIRSVQTAGALETILSLCVAYAGERVAFERPIGKFQAVQQNLARLAGEVAAALAVSGSATDAIAQAGSFDEAVFLEAAAAKIRSAEAAAEGSAIAHQVFGAIGFTQEHLLHRFTLRMLSWRDDFGNESYWAAELGRRVAARGADEFWPLVASR